MMVADHNRPVKYKTIALFGLYFSSFTVRTREITNWLYVLIVESITYSVLGEVYTILIVSNTPLYILFLQFVNIHFRV